jgi:hypothetical protein
MKKRKSTGRRIGYKRRPKRQKTYAEVCELQSNEFWLSEDTGIVLYFEDTMVGQQIYLGELLAKFYRINEDQPPLVFQFMENTNAPFPEKTWYAIMRGNFFIEIIEGHRKEGPHQTKLWFQTFTDRKSHWIASLQLVVFYFNETQVREALLKAIAEKEFYMTPENRDRAIIP